MPAEQSRFTWESGDTRNDWTLLLDGAPVADLSRGYSTRWGGAGRGRVAAKDKPMHWTLVPWGANASVKACADGSSVAVAKAAAEAIIRRMR